jgi:FkbM family methyltransferase
MSKDTPAEAQPAGLRHQVNELDLLLAFTEELDEVGLLVDVGAHVGSFAEAFAKRGWDVIAVEAAPDIHRELVDRLAPYAGVDVVHAAAGETGGGEVEFFLSSEYWGIHSLRPFDASHDTTVTVPTVRVADLLHDRPRSGPLVLKVDTEGADLLVLRGVDWASDRPRTVLCEFMDERTEPHFGYVYTDMIRFMEDRGYVAYVSEWAPVEEPSRRGSGGGPFTHLQIVRPPLGHQPAWGNLFFVSPEDETLFETVLNRYLIETRRASDRLASAGARSADRLAHLERSIGNRETKISGLEAALGQRDARVAELDAAIRQRDARIADLQSTIGQRDARVAELDEARLRLKKRNATIERRDALYRWTVGILLAVCLVLATILLAR